MLKALRGCLATCTVLAGLVSPGVLGRDTGGWVWWVVSMGGRACSACCSMPLLRHWFAQGLQSQHRAAVGEGIAAAAPLVCPKQCGRMWATAVLTKPAGLHLPDTSLVLLLLASLLYNPAASGQVHEVDQAERVGICVSVLHLPPGSLVQAAFIKTTLACEGLFHATGVQALCCASSVLVDVCVGGRTGGKGWGADPRCGMPALSQQEMLCTARIAGLDAAHILP